jgi:hypothetical protein
VEIMLINNQRDFVPGFKKAPGASEAPEASNRDISPPFLSRTAENHQTVESAGWIHFKGIRWVFRNCTGDINR